MEPNQALADELLAALQFDHLAELEMALQENAEVVCGPQIQQVNVTQEAILPPSPVAEEIVDLSNNAPDVKPNLDELLWLTQTVGLQNQASFNSVGSADLQALLGPCHQSQQPITPQQQVGRVLSFFFFFFSFFFFFGGGGF